MNEQHQNLTEPDTGISAQFWILSVSASSGKRITLRNSMYVGGIPLIVPG